MYSQIPLPRTSGDERNSLTYPEPDSSDSSFLSDLARTGPDCEFDKPGELTHPNLRQQDLTVYTQLA